MKILFCLCVVGLGLAACQKPEDRHAYQRNSSPKPASTRIAPDESRGPPECDEWLTTAKDVPIQGLFARMRQAVKAKTEFETTVAFNERAEHSFAPIVDGISRQSGIAKVATTYRIRESEVDYDADAGKMNVSLAISSLLASRVYIASDMSAMLSGNYIPIVSNRGASGTYVGANAFGATRTVTDIRGDEYGLAVTSGLSQKSWSSAPVAVDPARAQTVKRQLGVRLIGEIVPPGWQEGITGSNPTINNPRDITITGHFVTVKLVCAALIATDSMEVLRRFK